MTTTQNTKTAPIAAWDIHVDVRSKKTVLATDLTLDEAEAFLTTMPGDSHLAVVLPSGSLLNAGRSFTMFLNTLRGAKARTAMRAAGLTPTYRGLNA